MPTRWVSHYRHTYLFEKQNNSTWLEINQKKLEGNYSRIWEGLDEYGDPVVVVSKIDEPKVLKLTEGKLFWGQTQDTIGYDRFVPGYWGQEAKKDGKWNPCLIYYWDNSKPFFNHNIIIYL